MDRKELEKKISDIFFRALTSKISEKQMHDEIKLVLKEFDKVRLLKRDCPNCKTQFDKFLDSCSECKIEFGEHYL